MQRPATKVTTLNPSTARRCFCDRQALRADSGFAPGGLPPPGRAAACYNPHLEHCYDGPRRSSPPPLFCSMSEPPSYLFNLVLAQADAAPAIEWVMVTLKLSLVLFLVTANGFFVATEFALVGVRRSRIETLAAAGNAAARRLLKQLNDLNAYLSASSIGNHTGVARAWLGR